MKKAERKRDHASDCCCSPQVTALAGSGGVPGGFRSHVQSVSFEEVYLLRLRCLLGCTVVEVFAPFVVYRSQLRCEQPKETELCLGRVAGVDKGAM